MQEIQPPIRMRSDRFLRAVEFVLQHEGEWSNHPSDPGGRTRWGISSRAHPDVDLDTLTREQAIEIYRREYWERIRGDELPWPLVLVVMDHAVHSGVHRAVEMLQAQIGATVDGIVGPQTLARASRPSDVRVPCLLHQRLEMLVDLGGPYRLGWMSRVIDLAIEVGKELA